MVAIFQLFWNCTFVITAHVEHCQAFLCKNLIKYTYQSYISQLVSTCFQPTSATDVPVILRFPLKMAQCHVVRPTIFDAFQIALCMDDVSVHLPFILAFPAIENAHLKCLESQFRYVCQYFGSINNNCALRYCHTWQRYIVHVIVTKFMYCISIVVTLVPLCRCTSKFISFSDSLPNSDTFCASFAPFQI